MPATKYCTVPIDLLAPAYDTIKLAQFFSIVGRVPTKLRNAISYADPYETVERKASAMALLCDDVLRDFDGTLPCGVRGRRLFYLSER